MWRSQDGLFGKVRFRRGWQDLTIRPQDIAAALASDVTTLIDYVQQVTVEAVDAPGRLLADSLAMAGSAPATLLAAREESRGSSVAAGDAAGSRS